MTAPMVKSKFTSSDRSSPRSTRNQRHRKRSNHGKPQSTLHKRKSSHIQNHGPVLNVSQTRTATNLLLKNFQHNVYKTQSPIRPHSHGHVRNVNKMDYRPQRLFNERDPICNTKSPVRPRSRGPVRDVNKTGCQPRRLFNERNPTSNKKSPVRPPSRGPVCDVNKMEYPPHRLFNGRDPTCNTISPVRPRNQKPVANIKKKQYPPHRLFNAREKYIYKTQSAIRPRNHGLARNTYKTESPRPHLSCAKYPCVPEIYSPVLPVTDEPLLDVMETRCPAQRNSRNGCVSSSTNSIYTCSPLQNNRFFPQSPCFNKKHPHL